MFHSINPQQLASLVEFGIILWRIIPIKSIIQAKTFERGSHGERIGGLSREWDKRGIYSEKAQQFIETIYFTHIYTGCPQKKATNSVRYDKSMELYIKTLCIRYMLYTYVIYGCMNNIYGEGMFSNGELL